MKQIYLLFIPLLLHIGELLSQDLQSNLVKGIHIGVVQPFVAFHKKRITSISDYDFYMVGFPVGITFNSSETVYFDFEVVPFIKPYINDHTKPYEVHILYHPGVLVPIGHNFTLGLRAAFEPEIDQFGFTPLINKSYKLRRDNLIFTELVFPGRFGPEKSSGYTQVIGLHLGLAF